MKRLNFYTTILFTLVFPLKGITLYQHSCHGTLVSIELFQKTVELCCETSANTCDGCENHETVLVLDEFQAPEVTVIVSTPDFISIIEHNTQTEFHISDYHQVFINSKREPPVKSGRFLSILNQSFLI